MSEQTFKNPYLAENMPEGGGLTRDIVVTSAKYVMEPMTRKDGSKVVDDKGNQQYFIGLRIVGISTDPRQEGRESKYDYSSGKKSKPSADGELLLNEKGEPATVYKTSNLGRAIEGLAQGGFDRATLYPKVSILVGAKITLEGSDQKKADGTVKTYVGTDGKTHNSLEWFPVAYNGGAGSRTGNGAGKSADELATKAEAAVLSAITAAGGSIERKDLTRALATALKGDADAIKVTTLAATPSFHEGRPWTVEGTKLSLGA